MQRNFVDCLVFGVFATGWPLPNVEQGWLAVDYSARELRKV